MPATPRRVAHFLQQRKGLASLSDRFLKHQQLLAHTRRALPDPLRRHCVDAVLNHSTLTLSVDSPVWHARLRYLAPSLLSRLRQTYPGLANIRIRVAHGPEATPRSAPRSRPRHSEQGAAIVEQASADISDPALSDALARLARALKTD